MTAKAKWLKVCMRLVNALGEVVANAVAANQTLELQVRELPAGMYMLLVTHATYGITTRVIVIE